GEDMCKIMSWVVPLLLLGVAGFMIAWPGLQLRNRPSEEQAVVSAAAPSTRVIESEVRRQARERAEKQLEWADQESKHHLAECIEPIQVFFRDAEQGIPGFVDEALGWRSKWNFVLDRMPFTTTGHHEAFMREAFGRHLFKPEQLAGVLKQCIDGLLADVEG